MVNEFNIKEVGERLRRYTALVAYWKRSIGYWNKSIVGKFADKEFSREGKSVAFTNLNRARNELKETIKRAELVLNIRSRARAQFRL